MQSSLFPPSDPLAAVLWCRPCLGCGWFALGLPVPLPVGVSGWLRQHCQVDAVQALPSGGVAVRVKVPPHLLPRFQSLPTVRGGSRHESNLLPW